MRAHISTVWKKNTGLYWRSIDITRHYYCSAANLFRHRTIRLQHRDPAQLEDSALDRNAERLDFLQPPGTRRPAWRWRQSCPWRPSVAFVDERLW